MIKGNCRTNLDDYKRQIWPTVFADNLAVGHTVRSEDGQTLKVVNITHSTTKTCPFRSPASRKHNFEEKPYIIVELNK